MHVNLYLLGRNVLLTLTLLSTTVFSMVYAAAGGVPGPPPGKGPPPGVVNKITCRTSLVATITQSNMNFGTFAVTANGVVTLSPNGFVTAAGGADTVTSPVSVFTISIDNPILGCEAFDLLITLPTTATLSEIGGATMTLSNFVAAPVSSATTIAAPIIYPYSLNIGADINATFPQTEGGYTTPAGAYSTIITY